MLSASIQGLLSKESDISQIRIISLAAYFDDISVSKFVGEIEELSKVETVLDLIGSPTSSVVETLTHSLSKMKNDDPIFIKDCDNYFDVWNEEENQNGGGIGEKGNYVCFANLMHYPMIPANNKSFVTFDSNMILQGIFEKSITGPLINVGGVKLECVSDFLSAALSIRMNRESYVSDVIRVMIENGVVIRGKEVSNYLDWGTLSDWRRYTDSFATLFVDLDGVMVYNENPLSVSGGWDSFLPITENVQFLLKIQEGERLKIVFTTARNSRNRGFLENELSKLGFRNFELLMSLPHSRRYLVNDFADTNNFPTAIAVNLPRNASNLSKYLYHLGS